MDNNQKKLGVTALSIAAATGLVVGVVLTKKFGVKPLDAAQVVNEWTDTMHNAGFQIFAFNPEQVNYLNHLMANNPAVLAA